MVHVRQFGWVREGWWVGGAAFGHVHVHPQSWLVFVALLGSHRGLIKLN